MECLRDSVKGTWSKVKSQAEGFGLYLHRRMTIIPIAGKDPNRVNLELGLGKCENVCEETFIIRDMDNRFTAQYNEFLKDYYLGL